MYIFYVLDPKTAEKVNTAQFTPPDDWSGNYQSIKDNLYKSKWRKLGNKKFNPKNKKHVNMLPKIISGTYLWCERRKKHKIVITKGGPGSGHHGHAGRPGKVGGSAPSGGKGKKRSAGKAPPETYPISTLPHDGNEDVGELMNAWLPGNKSWVDASYDERSNVKSAIARDLSERTGIPEGDVNAVIGQWAHSSNDGNLAALEMQEAAAEVLGVDMGEWQKAQLEKARQFEDKDVFWFKSREEDARVEYLKSKSTEAHNIWRQCATDAQNYRSGLYDPSPLTKDQRKTFIQEMYNWTQDELAFSLGPDDSVTLVRGINRDYMDYKVGDVLDYKGNAIESWSLSRSVAGDFASGEQFGTGMVIAITVPRKNIISTAVTGLGCLIEGEVIISGTVDGHKVRVYDLWQLDEVYND